MDGSPDISTLQLQPDDLLIIDGPVDEAFLGSLTRALKDRDEEARHVVVLLPKGVTLATVSRETALEILEQLK